MKLGFYYDYANPMLVSWNILDLVDELRSKVTKDIFVYRIGETSGIEHCDVVIFYRCLGFDSELLRRLKSKRILIGYLIDDLIWEGSMKSHGATVIRRWFRNADFFMLPSEYLARKVPADKPIIFRRPSLSEKHFSLLSQAPIQIQNPFRIVLSKGHVTPPFVTMAKEALGYLATELKGKPIEISYFYNGPSLFAFDNSSIKLIKHKHIPTLEDFFHKMVELSPDVILNLLPDDDFTRCKSYPKYLEAGALGTVLIASDIFPYQKSIRHGQTGFLASDPKKASRIIIDLLNKRQLMLDVRVAARHDVFENHLVSKTAIPFWLDLLNIYSKKEEIFNPEISEAGIGEEGLDLPKGPIKASALRAAVKKREDKKKILREKEEKERLEREKEALKDKSASCYEVKSTGNVSQALLFGKHIDISFDCPTTRINEISIYGATFSQKIMEPLTYQVWYKGKMLYSGHLKFLSDNQWWSMKFPEGINGWEGKRLLLKIKSKSKRAVAFYLGDHDILGQKVTMGDTALLPIALRVDRWQIP